MQVVISRHSQRLTYHLKEFDVSYKFVLAAMNKNSIHMHFDRNETDCLHEEQ